MYCVQRRFVLVDVVLIRLSQTDKCYAALMLNGVAHKKSNALEIFLFAGMQSVFPEY
jgi:hypothetical protein